MTPARIQHKTDKTWSLPAGATYIGAGSKWAEHFIPFPNRSRQPDTLAAARVMLRGESLACWCATPEPGQPDHCHGARLLEAAGQPIPADHLHLSWIIACHHSDFELWYAGPDDTLVDWIISLPDQEEAELLASRFNHALARAEANRFLDLIGEGVPRHVASLTKRHFSLPRRTAIDFILAAERRAAAWPIWESWRDEIHWREIFQ